MPKEINEGIRPDSFIVYKMRLRANNIKSMGPPLPLPYVQHAFYK